MEGMESLPARMVERLETQVGRYKGCGGREAIAQSWMTDSLTGIYFTSCYALLEQVETGRVLSSDRVLFCTARSHFLYRVNRSRLRLPLESVWKGKTKRGVKTPPTAVLNYSNFEIYLLSFHRVHGTAH